MIGMRTGEVRRIWLPSAQPAAAEVRHSVIHPECGAGAAED